MTLWRTKEGGANAEEERDEEEEEGEEAEEREWDTVDERVGRFSSLSILDIL